jgi:hypothetical protein
MEVVDILVKKGGTFFEAKTLPEEQREQLCRELLGEFGATNIKRTVTKELIHSCPLPFGGHKNGDRNPSASLNFAKLTFNCLGCGNAGGLLWFIASCRGEESAQARQWLEKQTGLGQTVMDLKILLDMLDSIYSGESDDRPPMPRYSDAVLDPWTKWEIFHPYLTDGMPEIGVYGRGIPEETLQHFQVGYADDYFDHTERIIIPARWRGRLVGWQARHILGSDHADKYRNSPEFPREQIVFNEPAINGTPPVVVESPMSVLRHFNHQDRMLSTYGAKLSETQLRILRRYPDLTLWFDNDVAGWNATETVGEENSRHQQVWVVPSPYAADPADLPDELVDSLIAQRIPYAIWNLPTELIKWEG